MSEPDVRPAEPPAEPPTACSLCAEPIRSTYYRTGAMVFCPSCRAAAGAERGTRWSRALRAITFGGLAAMVSAAVWYTVILLTDREFGLLAIGVGLFVGAAVRWGSHRKGGWRYQALAVFLTYSGIVAAYVPMEIQAAFEEMESAQPAEEGEDLLPTSLEEADAVAVEVVGDTDIAPLAAEATLPRVEEAWQEPVGAGGLLIGFAILVGLIYAAPFLGGFENVLGWVILAIALYEAWKLNRREELVFEGPLQIPGTRPAYVPEIPPPPISP